MEQTALGLLREFLEQYEGNEYEESLNTTHDYCKFCISDCCGPHRDWCIFLKIKTLVGAQKTPELTTNQDAV